LILFLFESTHAVITAERSLKSSNIQFKIIPVPRTISSQCGMAIEAEKSANQIISEILAKNKINFRVFNQYEKI